MYKMIAALTFLAITSATLTGCNDKEGSTGNAAATKTTYYSSYKCNIDSIAGKISPELTSSVPEQGVACHRITRKPDGETEPRQSGSFLFHFNAKAQAAGAFWFLQFKYLHD
nr:hypothetical protein [Pseudomonas savastanoi]